MTAGTLADQEYQVIVIGGGIYGILIGLESALRGQRTLVLERDRLGGATTANWLRILHGGLRYLQNADLVRFFESVNERRWFMRHFPEFVEPLPCVMPLYRSRSHPAWIMRAGLLANDLLSWRRNRGVDGDRHIAHGRIVSADASRRALPFVAAEDLTAGAEWHDAIVTQPEALQNALIAWAQSAGATFVEGVEVTGLATTGERVSGVSGRSTATGETMAFRAPIVINAAGHWAPDLSRRFGAVLPTVPHRSWAWNVLFDVPYQAQAAAAVAAPVADAQNLFIVPWQGKALAGTGHACIPDGRADLPLDPALLSEFVSQASAAAPGLGISEAAIEKVYLGWMPVTRCRPLRHALRPMLCDHRREGLAGLFTVWGVKYTTARKVAEQVLNTALPGIRRDSEEYRRPA